MRPKLFALFVGILLSFFCLIPPGQAQTVAGVIGQFESHGDVGKVMQAGSASFDAQTKQYSISASGENMWANSDAFHFVWKKASGDVAISAEIGFPTATGNPHKKAVLMIRQSLDADSAYVDAALHVVGLTSLQSRGEQGGATHEIGTEGEAATQMRLEKRGDYFYLYVARKGEAMHLAGGSIKLALKEPFYIGLGVCAHDKDALETAEFTNVTIGEPKKGKLRLYSTLETVSVSSTDRRVVGVFKGRLDAVGWSQDGTHLLFRQGKKLEQITPAGGKAELAAGGLTHKIKGGDRPSPDGQKIASLSYLGKSPADAELSVRTVSDGKSKVVAKLLAGQGTLGESPWSMDGKRLMFVSYQMLPAEK